MKLIIQANFNQGYGDGFMAMCDYMRVATDLKKLGYDTNLNFWLNRNYYYKSKSPLDYIDIECLNMFNTIQIINKPLTKIKEDGYTCVFTHAGAGPSLHYWDLYVDDESVEFFNKNYKVVQFCMNDMVRGIIPDLYPKLNSEILNKYDEFLKKNKVLDYDTIYFRTQDLQDEPNFIQSYENQINEIIDRGRNIFVCSNSYELKKLIKKINKKNVFYWELPLEEKMGGNHYNHQTISDDDLHSRNIYTLLDMWTLGKSNEIFFFTTWRRYSNFLLFAPIHKSKINYFG